MAACGTKGLAALIPCVCTNCRIWEAEASACPCTWPGLGGAMGCAQTRQGQQLHGCPLPQNGLAVFDPQNVVGRLQQIRSTGAQCFGGCGTGGGKGQAAFQLAAQRRRERRTAQRGSRLPARGGTGFRHRTQGTHPSAASSVPGQRQTVLRWRWRRAQGSATTRSAPAASAARTRTASGRMGTPPRCTTPVLMHTAMVLAPRCRSMRSCNAWPLWNGSYSAMMPTKFISSPPDSPQILFACAEKSLAMFSASLYNKFV